ncbi:sensor domain-containing diguanylate cyclase [Hydrogenophaga aquatica]
MPPTETRPAHWIVEMNHKVRSGIFAVVFVMMLSHLAQGTQSWTVWGWLVLQFLVYPHLIYLWGRYAEDPTRVEMRALLLDPLLIGGWLAWLGFPLWISFPVAIGTLISISLYRGTRGTLQALAALIVGAAVVMVLDRPHFEPQTDGLTTALSMLALSAYLLMVAEGARQRGLKLRAAREELRSKEQALQRQLDANRVLQQQLQEQANRDPLTGLFNRRYLDATMERELARCQRESQPLSLLVMDIDHFKRINDEHGHPAGDEVLRQVAQLLAGRARNSDVVCRYGGEEYLVLLPNMTAHTALVRAEEYRSQLQAMGIPFEDKTLRTTLSIGMASFPKHGRTVHELIRLADAALYQAKQAGRNRVVEATPCKSSTP